MNRLGGASSITRARQSRCTNGSRRSPTSATSVHSSPSHTARARRDENPTSHSITSSTGASVQRASRRARARRSIGSSSGIRRRPRSSASIRPATRSAWTSQSQMRADSATSLKQRSVAWRSRGFRHANAAYRHQHCSSSQAATAAVGARGAVGAAVGAAQQLPVGGRAVEVGPRAQREAAVAGRQDRAVGLEQRRRGDLGQLLGPVGLHARSGAGAGAAGGARSIARRPRRGRRRTGRRRARARRATRSCRARRPRRRRGPDAPRPRGWRAR